MIKVQFVASVNRKTSFEVSEMNRRCLKIIIRLIECSIELPNSKLLKNHII